MGRRSDGLYRRRKYFYFKYKETDGTWHERATRTRHYEEARAIRKEFLDEFDQAGLPPVKAKWTLQQAVEHWLADRKQRITAGSFASEKAITKTLLRVLGSETQLSKLANVDRVRAYENSRLAQGLCAKSINNETVVLAGMLREARLWRRIEPDYKRLPVRESDKADALKKEEGYRLLQLARTCSNDLIAPFAAVLSYATGLRSGEMKQLQLGSIDLNSERPQLYVRRATTKTNRGARFVALDRMACWALQKLLCRAQRLGSTKPEHYLFPTRLDKHTRSSDPLHARSGWDPTHHQTSWEKEWNAFRKQVGIENRRFHDLRHSYITRAAEAGVPILVVQAQVGHMSAAMVEHYCHISQAAVHRAAELIEQQNPDLLLQLGIPERSPVALGAT